MFIYNFFAFHWIPKLNIKLQLSLRMTPSLLSILLYELNRYRKGANKVYAVGMGWNLFYLCRQPSRFCLKEF